MIFRIKINNLPHEQSINLHQLVNVIIVSCMIVSCNPSVEPIDATFEPGPILFVSNTSGTWQLWSLNEDGSDVKQLTYDPDFQIFGAKWSPDGTQIAIIAFADPGNANEFATAIYLMNADGTGVETLVSQSDLLEYVNDWHPHKEELLINYFDYSRRDSAGVAVGRWQLGIMNLKGEYLQTLSQYEINEGQGRISYDGFRIAFEKDRKLFVRDIESNSDELLFDEAEFQAPFAWSPSDSDVLFQATYPNGRRAEIYTINTQTKKIQRITPFESTEETIRVTSWRRR